MTRLNLAFKSHPLLIVLIGTAVLLLFILEVYRAVSFYSNLTQARDILIEVRADLDIVSLDYSEEEVLQKRDRLQEAVGHLDSAASFAKTDPLLNLARLVPEVGKQASGLRTLVFAAHESAVSGIEASDVALAFSTYERPEDVTSLEAALDFIGDQEEPMARVDAGLTRLRDYQQDLPQGLWGPLGRAANDLDDAIDRLGGLVEGYNRASTFLPDVLGQNSRRTYLLLPQNDTELFPSGGLISSYGLVSFEGGRLEDVFVEYFGTLYERWQAETGGEYIEPPAQLKNYLKRDYSWALGEAGWYPDFPTTAALARDFVSRGGVPDTDGVIAIDTKFLAQLLDVLGPVEVPEYNVTVTPENSRQLTLELTRDENYQPGQTKKAFLGYMANALLDKLLSTPKDQWVNLLKFLDRMGKERHLQLNFNDSRLQALSSEYGFAGDLLMTDGDFLLIADTSVHSTKLNLILEPSAQMDVTFEPDLSTHTEVRYEIHNPLPEWAREHDEDLVRKLFLGGVYGCYARIYVPKNSELSQVLVNGQSVGAEESAIEYDRGVFGRFFLVGPGETNRAEFSYDTPRLVTRDPDGAFRYSLYVQKEAGTGATPFTFHVEMPEGATLVGIWLDGEPIQNEDVATDLRTDRRIEVSFRFE
jgi:hypothetical protein